MRSIPWRLWTLALASAVLQVLPFPIAGPVPIWRRIFCWICLAPLLWALTAGRDKTGNRLHALHGALLGYVCGVAWYAGNCYWIYQTMYLYGGIPKPLSLGILILFSMYLGLYHALFGCLMVWVREKKSAGAALCLSPFLWVAVELARARITGFPWDLLGYTQVDHLLLTRLAPWTGVMGLSFLIAAVNAMWLAAAFAKRSPVAMGITILAALATLGFTLFGHSSVSSEPTGASAVLLQENLGVGTEGQNNQESKQQMLQSFSQLSEHPSQGTTDHASLIVWPEAPTSFVDSDPVLRDAISALAQKLDSGIIINDVTFASRNSSTGRYNLYNSATFFSRNGTYVGRYDKMHLVPFGEYTPYKPLFFFVGHLLDDLPFIPGTQRSSFTTGGRRFGVFICYESIFGDEIRQFAANGTEVLVNISDDGWYGDTSAPWEHLDMARMRAIENHRWLLRSTNTGLTAAINPAGQITEELPRHVRGSLVAHFSAESDLTFYTVHGDWFAYLCAVIVALAVLLEGMRPRLLRGMMQDAQDEN